MGMEGSSEHGRIPCAYKGVKGVTFRFIAQSSASGSSRAFPFPSFWMMDLRHLPPIVVWIQYTLIIPSRSPPCTKTASAELSHPSSELQSFSSQITVKSQSNRSRFQVKILIGWRNSNLLCGRVRRDKLDQVELAPAYQSLHLSLAVTWNPVGIGTLTFLCNSNCPSAYSFRQLERQLLPSASASLDVLFCRPEYTPYPLSCRHCLQSAAYRAVRSIGRRGHKIST